MLALLLLFAAAQAQRCPTEYQRFSDKHTFCRPQDPQCDIRQSSVTDQDKAIILDEHNKYRSRVALGRENIGNLPQATNMMQMVWDDELAAVAQRQTRLCLYQHDCNECREVKNFRVGQNMYNSNMTGSATEPGRDWKAAVKAWYDEVVYFSSNYISPFVPASGEPTYGHFSQVVWADSWRIGCGYTTYLKDGTFVQLYSCNYGPGGNIRDGSMYDKGQTCSQCPINACCDDNCGKAGVKKDYSGLCKMIRNEAPRYPRKGGDLFYCDFNDEPDCGVSSVTGANKWLIQSTLSGNYLSIVLNGGETSTLTFAKTLKPQQSACFILDYRKGPNVAGQESGSSASEEFLVPSIDYKVSQPLRRDTNQFMKFSMGLGWSMETQVSIKFTVPSGKPPQYLEIRNLRGNEGPC